MNRYAEEQREAIREYGLLQIESRKRLLEAEELRRLTQLTREIGAIPGDQVVRLLIDPDVIDGALITL